LILLYYCPMPEHAFIFDLNGTMVDDMAYHVQAWYRIFREQGATISLERMRQECYEKNNEVIERIMPGRFNDIEKSKLSFEKEKEYRRKFKPFLSLVPGLKEFLEKAYTHKIPMAIGSAAIMPNVDFILDNLGIRNYFSAVVSADEVLYSKPDPETYIKCATLLNVNPDRCIVFEDAPRGVESAQNAGMKSVVVTLWHRPEEFLQYTNILAFISNFTDKKLAKLIN